MIERGHWTFDKTVLDVGSGAGIQADLISSLANIDVTCLDMEPRQIDNPRCRFVHGNALDMPFLSASFDGLYCSYLYHLIDDFKDSFLL